MIYLICGVQGSGKTYATKQILEEHVNNGFEPFIYDVNSEYENEYPDSCETDFDIITEVLNDNHARGIVFVIEEAMLHFNPNSSALNVIQTLIRIRHKNCAILLLFHRVLDIPDKILGLADWLVLCRVRDKPKKLVEKLNPDLLPYVEKHLQEGPDIVVTDAKGNTINDIYGRPVLNSVIYLKDPENPPIV